MKAIIRIITIAGLISCLAACGSNNDNSSPPAGGGTTTPPAGGGTVTAMLDSFGTFVASLIGMTSETTAPVSIDSTVVTQPENTQPAPIAQ